VFVHDVLLLVLLFHGFYLDLVYCLNNVLLLGSCQLSEYGSSDVYSGDDYEYCSTPWFLLTV
jgi:hypothetical protein